MNEFLQIGVGIAPSIIVIILLCVKRRIFSARIFLSILLLTLITTGMVFVSTKHFETTELTKNFNNTILENKTKKSNRLKNLSKEQLLLITNKFFVNEEYDLVKSLINDYVNLYGYDYECRLLNARMSLLHTDYNAANALYQNLKKQNKLSNENVDELEFTERLTSDNVKNSQVVNYLISTGGDLSKYGFKESDYRGINKKQILNNEDIINKIKVKIEKNYSDDVNGTFSTFADILMRISKSNKKYAELKNDIEKLDEIIKTNVDFLNIDTTDRLIVKANLLDNNYESIVANLNDDSSYHSLIVTADLIMGKIVEGDINNNINDNISNETIDLIDKKLLEIKNENTYSLNNQQQNALKERIESLNSQLDNPTLYTIKNKLVECNYDEKDESKVQFTLAKINNYFDNSMSSNDCLSNAINSAYKSDDKNYKDAMNNLNYIISNNSNSYNGSYINNYINSANINSLTIGDNIKMPIKIENAVKLNFVKDVTNNVIKAKNYIRIGEIGTSKFKTVSADVIITNEQLKSTDELKNIVEIRDCGDIVTARFDKINYDSVNIMLVCDVSSSMLDNINSLKKSINKFIDDKNDNEVLSIVSFASNILGEESFNSPKESLHQFVEGFRANGGTNIYGTVQSCINKFQKDSNSKNILIVITDGQDGKKYTLNEINAEIGQLAKENMVTIYTMGLGNNVDETYLDYIATAGGGNYIPVQDGSSLSTFYDMLHMQANNLYRITYDANNLSERYDRTLEVSFPDSIYKDLEIYSLVDRDEISNSYEFKGGQVVNGVFPQSIYKSDYATNVMLKGQNFNKDDNISIKFLGPVNYNINLSFKDSDNYNVVVPKIISVGNYDVVVTINDVKKVFYNAFKVNEIRERKWLKFGAYNFTYDDNDYIDRTGGALSGNIQMNGWLNFKGKLAFSGNYEADHQLIFTDSSGSYIEFDKTYSKGVAKDYAEKNLVVNIPPLNKFKLYNDEHNYYNYDEYKVDNIQISRLELPNFIAFDGKTLKISLYPDKLSFSVNNDISLLGFNNTLRKISKGSLPLEFEFNLEKAVISSSLIGINIVTDFNMSDVVSSLIPIYIFNQKIFTSPSAKLTLNTIEDEYDVELACELGFIGKKNEKGKIENPGLGFTFGFKKNMFEKFNINLISPVGYKILLEPPIEANNFAFEISNISDAIEKGDWKRIKLTGQLDLSSCKASEYILFLKKIPVINEISLLSMPETKSSLTFSPFGIENEARVMLLGLIEGASFETKIGNYNYSSSILNIRDEELFGFLGSKKSGLTINGLCGYFKDKLVVDLSGKITGMVNQRFIGFTNLGTTIFKASLWAFEKNYSAYNESAIGFYVTHAGKNMLVFATKDQNKNGNNNSQFYYIDENWSIGQINGQLT